MNWKWKKTKVVKAKKTKSYSTYKEWFRKESWINPRWWNKWIAWKYLRIRMWIDTCIRWRWRFRCWEECRACNCIIVQEHDQLLFLLFNREIKSKYTTNEEKTKGFIQYIQIEKKVSSNQKKKTNRRFTWLDRSIRTCVYFFFFES